MNFNLNDEQKIIQSTAREFAVSEILPGVIDRDEKKIWPADIIKKMGELGFMGINVPEKYGGSEMNYLSY